MNIELNKTRPWIGGLAACVVALLAGRTFYTKCITPLALREKETLQKVAELTGRIENAGKTIVEVGALGREAEGVHTELACLRQELPSGAATVGVPALVKEHFARIGIAVPLVRLNTIQDDPELPGHGHGYWSAAMPIDGKGQKVRSMLVAVAELERRNPFLRVLDFAIRPDPENPRGQVGLLNVKALILK